MKNISILILLLTVLFVGCQDDFLDKMPEDSISEGSFWKTEKDLETYANGLYQAIPNFRGWASKYSVDSNSDNALGTKELSFPHGNLFRTSSDASSNDNSWNGAFSWLRKINYMIGNLENYDLTSLSDNGKHYVGEAYFFRAYQNFELLSRFGAAPYVDQVANLDSEDILYKERMPRHELAMKVMEDLDMAIANLQWAGTGSAVKGRISKDAALGYKTRYALFEGSWEFYHKDTAYGVSGKDGKEFLDLAVAASAQLMDKLGATIFIGETGKEYWELFNQKDYSVVPGVLHYQVYSKDEGITVKWANYARGGGQIGMTKAVVDDYLMANGEPKEINTTDYVGDNTFVDLTTNRDPRLAQTIYYSDKWGSWGDIMGNDALDWMGMTAITPAAAYYAPTTGYGFAKGILGDKNELSDYGWGEQGWIHLRYAEVLLANAEAKAILEELGSGTLTQTDLDKTVNVLRDRVDMTHMNLAAVKSWNSNGNYFKRYGNVSSVINEIRRERRIEFVGEGIRYDDLRRWKMLGHLINGNVPRGAKAQQFINYWEPKGKLTRADLKIDSQGYLLPGGHRGDFQENGDGYQIDEGRDYLWSVPKGQINLYKKKGNVELSQNPGWN